jgi:endonuclease/exonuclease/phosphatase family metal-dependent hydrolase
MIRTQLPAMSAVGICILLSASMALADETELNLDRAAVRKPGTIRIATFNISLAGQKPGEMLTRLQAGDDLQAKAVAEIIQRVQPDVLFLNELDFDERGDILTAFVDNYLAKAQGVSTAAKDGDKPAAVKYEHRYTAPVNTGIASKFDLDRDGVRGAELGTSAYARDALGYGQYPGQYGMAILSRFPIDESHIRTFQKLRWRDMPNSKLPTQKDDSPWYEAAALEDLPLSSKSHWDVPIRVGSRTIHILASHPTPPVFDGPEDRNGRRNHDEIRLWADYLTPADAKYIVDDRGQRGGLDDNDSFVIVGDLNSDPEDGSGELRPIRMLLKHARVNATLMPQSAGALAAAERQGGANGEHLGKAEADTGDFPDEKGPGNLRLDYVLPSRDLGVVSGGVYWPRAEDARYALVGAGHPVVSSDHRLVWLDIEAPADEKVSK